MPVNALARQPALNAHSERGYRPHAMADEPDNRILHMLRRIDNNVSEMREDLRDLQRRVTHLEEGMAGFNRRMDRFDARLDRIERRLEISDAVI